VNKRSERYLAKKAAKRKASQEALKKVPQESEKKPPKYRRFLRIAEWVLGPILAVVAAVYTFWGPPWPMVPVFSPGFPSAGFALNVPFTITNRSALFPLKHMQILCGIYNVELSNKLIVQGFAITASGSEGSTLEPLASASYTCAFTKAIGLPKEVSVIAATINFITKYDSRWPFGHRSESESDQFTLNTQTTPPQWTAGKPLR
jgi:hypothetical protein